MAAIPTLGGRDGFPELRVLDSTVPGDVRAAERGLDWARTLFLVSSKSGRTTEADALRRYFFEKVKRELGAVEAGSRFVAITDVGTSG